MYTQVLKEQLRSGTYASLLAAIYADSQKVSYQTERYINALETYESLFGPGEVSLFSAPGRSEVGGNHTDHQHGEVLAASINDDVIAVAAPLSEASVRLLSDNGPMITISLDDLEAREKEQGTTAALVKGVLAGLVNHGFKIGGFQAYLTSDVLIGAGLSSSASFESIIGVIESGLYNDLKLTSTENAIIGQFAENVYFGKPCGLMDQMACATGGMVHIDFADPKNPVVEQIPLDLDTYGFSLCIVDTKGSHADLTADYAAIPAEMKLIASYFGKDYLRDVTKEQIIAAIPALRDLAGDRAVLRALHFEEENVRVQKEVACIKAGDFQGFLKIVRQSGQSSFQYLQNVYTSHDVQHQNVSVALCVSDSILGDQGACRVHGGGFAGTIQAFVPNDLLNLYKDTLDHVFGENSCKVLKIRSQGGIQVL